MLVLARMRMVMVGRRARIGVGLLMIGMGDRRDHRQGDQRGGAADAQGQGAKGWQRVGNRGPQNVSTPVERAGYN